MEQNLEKKNSNRIIYLDILNILACLSVIGLHVNYLAHDYSDTILWRQCFAVEVLAYWAVPVFIMLSGANLINYRSRYTTKSFFMHRFKKVIIPLILWTIIFYCWKRFRGEISWVGWQDFLSTLINFRVVTVYWFFAPLIMVYLAMPVLSKLAQEKKILFYMFGISFLFNSVLPFVSNILLGGYNYDFTFQLASGYIMLAVLGYLLHITELTVWVRILIYISGIIAACVRYFYTIHFSKIDGTMNQFTWGYTNWTGICLAAAVFVLVKYLCRFLAGEKYNIFSKVVMWMSSASFGIYLIHLFILDHLRVWFHFDGSEAVWRLLFPFVVYAVALAIVKCIQKISYVGKWLFP